MTKPQMAGGYVAEETELVRAACLTVAAILGDLMDDICIVGGLVPSMICSADVDPAAAEDAHCGTTDLDIGLSLGLLDDERYKEMAERLRSRDFQPDRKENDRITRQRWRWRNLKVTIDFLIPPTEDHLRDGRLQDLEKDLAALVVKPLHLAFEEQLAIEIAGSNLFADRLRRTINFSGPAAFLAMKAYAYRLRGEPKDAYDLVFVLRHWEGGLEDICKRLFLRASAREAIVKEVLEYLSGDFETTDSAGPRDYSRFVGGTVDPRRVADAHGAVADFLSAYSRLAAAEAPQ